jgi:hypothetical protein
MKIGAIESKSGHEAALREIEALWGATEGDRLDVLATLVAASEATYFDERANLEAFDRFMNREGGEPPRAGDELPPADKRRR